MKDARRLTLGRKTVTSSEDEERGRGKRTIIKKLSDDFCLSAPDSPPHSPLPRKKKTVREEVGMLRRSPRKLNWPHLPNPLSSVSSIKLGPTSSAAVASTSKDFGKALSAMLSNLGSALKKTSASTEAQPFECRIKRKHICASTSSGQVNLQSIGHSLCALSSK